MARQQQLLEQEFVDEFFCLLADDLVLWIFDKLSAAVLALMVLLTVMDAAIFDDPLRSAARVRRRFSVHYPR